MSIYQIIKNWMCKITNKKVKLLVEGNPCLFEKNKRDNFINPTEKRNKVNNYYNSTENNNEINNLENDYTKTEFIKNILKTIGCEKEIFEKIADFSDVDVEILKNNIGLLSKYKFTKLELSKIITENTELLYVDNKTLEKNINQLREIFEDSEVKHCIYTCPYCLSNSIEDTMNVLLEYKISLEIQKYILLENPMILEIEKESLIEQLEFIKSTCMDFEEFIVKVMYMNMLLGTNQLDLITTYIKK